MTPNEMGQVFALLMKHREILGNPIDRPLRENELEMAKILASCTSDEMDDFEDFLNAQGLSLYVRQAFELGIPPKQGRPNNINVLMRKRNESLSPYISKTWFLEQMEDGRSNDSKTKTAIWTARLWLTLQWFFYQRIDRLPYDIAGYRNALVTKKLLIDEVEKGIERLGNEGRPEGEKGFVWDVLWNSKSGIEGYVTRFLKVMKTSGMIEGAGNLLELRQTLLAAVDMSVIAEHELTYLMPAVNESNIDVRTTELLVGATLNTEETEQ
jgi:hypothetical protein